MKPASIVIVERVMQHLSQTILYTPIDDNFVLKAVTEAHKVIHDLFSSSGLNISPEAKMFLAEKCVHLLMSHGNMHFNSLVSKFQYRYSVADLSETDLKIISNLFALSDVGKKVQSELIYRQKNTIHHGK